MTSKYLFVYFNILNNTFFPWCSPEQDADLEVVFEDQQRINMFARNNARLMDLKEEIDAKEVSGWLRYITTSED